MCVEGKNIGLLSMLSGNSAIFFWEEKKKAIAELPLNSAISWTQALV